MAEIKSPAGQQRIVLSEAVPLSAPFSVYVFPTNICNFRCTYCAQSLGRDGLLKQFGITPAHMDMATFQKIVEQLKEFPGKIKTVNLTGHGEPLLNPLLPEMINCLKKARVTERIEFMTNASILTPRLSARLIDAGLDGMRVSIQGLSGEEYLKICGHDIDFTAFVENIRWFYQHKQQCDLFVKIMDIALRPGGEEQFYRMFGDMADRVFVEKCMPVYEGVASTDVIQVTSDRYGRQHQGRTVCPLCFFMLGVFPNGDISPCETIYKPERLGNVHNTTLLSAWRGRERQSFLEAQLLGGRLSHKQCQRCSAPDDVSHPEDVLDGAVSQILERIKKQ